jgi:hypothetical protein
MMKKRRRKKIRNKILDTGRYLVILALVIFIFSFNIWCRVSLINIGYEIGKKEKSRKNIEKQIDKLRYEISYLCANYKTANKLKEKGYEYPGKWEILKVLAMKK